MRPQGDTTNGKRGTTAAVFALAYCMVVAVWTTLFGEGWKRQNAVLSHVWDVEDFEEEEDPRPEYLANFHRGRWKSKDNGGRARFLGLRGTMEKRRGFFTNDGRFLPSNNPLASEYKVFDYKYRIWVRGARRAGVRLSPLAPPPPRPPVFTHLSPPRRPRHAMRGARKRACSLPPPRAPPRGGRSSSAWCRCSA